MLTVAGAALVSGILNISDSGFDLAGALAAAWIYDGKTYLTLWETNQTTIDSNSTLVNSVLMGFSIQAIE